MVTFIYVLRDPGGNVRYVGRTRSDLKSRLIGHISESRWNRSLRSLWIRSLRSRNAEPTIDMLETFDGDHAATCEREAYWIKHYRDIGADLLNRGHTRGR